MHQIVESQRLARLEALQVLDTAAEPIFDSLAQAASAVCGTPVALIGFIDEHRHWIKANVGLPGATETPRNIAFCTHAIVGNDLLEIPDTLSDKRFTDNPLVQGNAGMRFYAGAPLVMSSGESLGTLCVIDYHPRLLTDTQRIVLKELAAAAVKALEFRVHARHYASIGVDPKFRTLSDASPFGIFHTDIAGGCTYTNASWQVIFGLSAEQSLGEGWSHTLFEDDREAVIAEWQRCAKAGADFDMTFRVACPGMSLAFVRAKAKAHFDAMGQAAGFVGVVQDITTERSMAEDLRRSNTVLQSILDNLPCGLSVFDGELRLSAYNQQFRDLLDLPSSLFAGPVTHFEDVVRNNAARGEYGPGPVEEVVARLVEGARIPKHMLFERERHDGKPLEVRSGPMPGGGFVTTYMDISERKRVDRLKGELISTVSHELRTPLTAIHGSLSMLADGTVGELPAEVQELILIAQTSSERLVRLINDVLDIEKIESKMMTYAFTVQSLALLVDQAIRTTQHFARKYDLQIVFKKRIDGVNVNGDADRIIQVLVNLLSNAVKFSERGSKVLVHMAVIGQQARVSVIDRGVGIPKEFRNQVFTRFSQVDSSDRRQKGGTGLGLFICKSLIEEHGGHIDFVSDLGFGSEFYFDLPLAT